MSPAPLVVASTVASLCGFGTIRANDVRLKLGLRALEWARETCVSFVLFPAGYLRAFSDRDVAGVAAPLVDAARKHGMAITIGIDTCDPTTARKVDLSEQVRRGALPFFGIAFVPGQPVKIWRQRSTTSGNGKRIPQPLAAEVREISLRKHRLAVLLCGESFSPVLRAGLTAGTPPIVLAVPAHEAAGMRHHNAFSFFTSHGTPMLRAVHAATGAKNELVRPGGSIAAVVSEKTLSESETWLHVRAFEL
jgi:hypothetical protein